MEAGEAWSVAGSPPEGQAAAQPAQVQGGFPGRRAEPGWAYLVTERSVPVAPQGTVRGEPRSGPAPGPPSHLWLSVALSEN